MKNFVSRALPALGRSRLAVVALAFTGLVGLAGAANATNIQRVVSPGGIEAWLVEEHTVPVIAMNFAFEGGSSQDADDKLGTANFLSGVLDEGAGDLDSKAFQARLDDLSVELGYDAGRDAFFGSLRTLSENRDAAFELLALSLQKPRFDAEPIERVRAQILRGLSQAKEDPDEVAGETLAAAAFPGHPYGKRSEGTPESLAAITPADLEGYRKRVFARDKLKVSVVGAIDAETLKGVLDKVFGPLPAKADLKPIPDVEPKSAKLTVDMANPQTVIRFGGPGLKRSDPDFMAGYIANHILGGGTFSSRLYAEVREKRGLAYSVSTTLLPMDHAGVFVGGTATRADRAGETLAIIEKEVQRLATDGPTADELAKAKSYLISSYPLRFDTSGKIAGQLLSIQLDNLGMDYADRRNGIIEAVTIDDVRRAAKRMYGAGLPLVVQVGPHES